MSVQSKTLSVQNWVTASFLLMIVALATKGFGIFRELLVAKYFGVGADLDAFVIALSLVNLLSCIGFSFSASLVPLYRKITFTEGVESAKHFAGGALVLATICSFLLALPFYIFPDFFIHLVVPRISELTTETSINLVRWLSLHMFGFNLLTVITAIYHAEHHFKIPAVGEFFSNVIVVVFLFCFSMVWGIYALLFGYLSNTVLLVSVLSVYLWKKRLVRFGRNFRYLKNYILLLSPLLLYEVAIQMGLVIQNYFASGLSEGSIAAISYSSKLTMAVNTLVMASLAKAITPTVSDMCAQKGSAQASDLFSRLVNQMILFFIPCTLLLLYFGKEMISLFFQGGAFDEQALNLTSITFSFYACGLLTAALEPIFLRIFCAFQDTRTPLLSALCCMVISIPMNIWFVSWIGMHGIALTVFVVSVLRTSISGIVLGTRLKVNLKRVVYVLISSILSAAIAGMLCLQLKEIISLGFISLMIILCGIYLVLGGFLMQKEFRDLIFIIRKICNKFLMRNYSTRIGL